MADSPKFLGSSKVSSKLRISIVKDVADHMELKDGDHILFFMEKDGRVYIQKG